MYCRTLGRLRTGHCLLGNAGARIPSGVRSCPVADDSPPSRGFGSAQDTPAPTAPVAGPYGKRSIRVVTCQWRCAVLSGRLSETVARDLPYPVGTPTHCIGHRRFPDRILGNPAQDRVVPRRTVREFGPSVVMGLGPSGVGRKRSASALPVPARRGAGSARRSEVQRSGSDAFHPGASSPACNRKMVANARLGAGERGGENGLGTPWVHLGLRPEFGASGDAVVSAHERWPRRG